MALLLRLLLLSFSEVRGELGVVQLAFLLSLHMHSQFTALALNKPSSSIVLGYHTLEQACSPVSPGDATHKEEIHRLKTLIRLVALPGVVGLVALEGLLGVSSPFYPF